MVKNRKKETFFMVIQLCSNNKSKNTILRMGKLTEERSSSEKIMQTKLVASGHVPFEFRRWQEIFLADFKEKRVSQFDCIFMVLLPKNFWLGEPILMINFYLKAGGSCVVPFKFGLVIGDDFLVKILLVTV